MRSLLLGIAAAVVLIAPTASARAAEDLIETVKNGCKTELESYCAKVKEGEGRIANCLKANNSKISKRCAQAMTDVGVK